MTTTEAPAPYNAEKALLAKKMVTILGSIGPVAKKGTNSHFNYKFVREEDLVARIRPLMVDAGVFMLVEVTSERKEGTNTTVEMNFELIDAETGYSFTGHGVGYGSDSGDKGASKAQTSCVKSWLMKTFLVSSGDDPEADRRTDQRSEREDAMRGQPVNITGTTAAQAQRGGYSDTATSTQIATVGALTRALKWDVDQTVAQINKFASEAEDDYDTLVVEEDEPKAKQAIKRYLAGLPSDMVGQLITLMTAIQATGGELIEGDDAGT